jgi:hypothetical protein
MPITMNTSIRRPLRKEIFVGPWVWIKEESEEKGKEKMKCELRGRHID